MRSKTWLRAAALVAAVGIWAGLASGGPEGGKPSEGQKAPSFAATSMTGEQVKFPEDYKGKLVLVEFWATWCLPCRAQIPHLKKTYDEYHDKGFEIVAVSLDASKRVAADRVKSFVDGHEMKWTQIYDDAAPIAIKYGVNAIPAAFLVDGNTGEVIATGSATKGEALGKNVKVQLEKIKKS